MAVLLSAGFAVGDGNPPNIEDVVKDAVASFDPLWSPPRGKLRGWVIGIDPTDDGGSEPDQRLRDDLNLLTAANLYHFVIKAGGRPVLTRADNTRLAESGEPRVRTRVDAVRRAGCHVCVSIRHTRDGETTVQLGAAGARPSDERLADALRGVLGGGMTLADSADADLNFIKRVRASAPDPIVVCEVRFATASDDPAIDAARRKLCLDRARLLFEGISQYCTTRLERAGEGDGAGPVPDMPIAKTSTTLQRLAHTIWPEGPLPIERLDWFCRRFAESSISNRTLVYFQVSAVQEQDAVALRGRTNAPRVVTGLKHALRAVGITNTRDEVTSLPDRGHLGEQLFGVCRVPMALTFDRPGPGAALQTQILFGEPLFLLDRDDEHYLLHAGDGYWGWVHRDAVQPLTAERFDAYMREPRAVALRDIEGPAVQIPRGSEVRLTSAGANECAILLPDGASLAVPADAVLLQDPGRAEASERVKALLELLHVPYVFGGRSPLGLDCSGLVTNAWARAGDKPPRDAWQQALAGRLVATRWHRTGIRAGDQVFFMNERGKMHHTGVALDATHVIHSAPPGVKIGSLDPDDRLYDPYLGRNFFLAKRP